MEKNRAGAAAMQEDTDLIMVITTYPSHEQALSMARSIVERHHGACVQVLPGITSTYAWQGKISVDSEVLVFIKTLRQNYTVLKAFLKQHHPYQEPQIVALSFTAWSSGYGQWMVNYLHKTKAHRL